MTKKFCSRCKCATEHEEAHESGLGNRSSGVGRLLEGAFTFGMSELFGGTVYECTECGKVRE